MVRGSMGYVKRSTIRAIPILVTMLGSMLLPAPVGAVPQPPHVFYGAVTVGGSPASNGLAVTASIAGATFPYTLADLTSAGRYGGATPNFTFKVPADDPDTAQKEGGVDGNTVIFYVQGVQAGTAPFQMGGVTQLSLAISSLPALAKPTNVQRTTPITNNTPTFTWTKVSNASSYQLRIDTSAFADVGDVSTHSFTSTIADGSHSFEVRGVQGSVPGPSADPLAFTIDTLPPSVTITALAPDPNNDSTPTLTGTASDTATAITSVEYRVDGGAWTPASAVDGSFSGLSENYTFTTSDLTEGSHTVQVRAADSAGHTLETNFASDTFTIDITPPSVTIIELSPDPTTTATPTFTGAATDAISNIASVMYR
ncbi:MAG: hypothetical protein HY667_00765, partial [Chloroflexi bacterium]|nr:hypothetical protein [Chloroflexota bacterium]